MATLFFSYSHKDEELRNELETHLALLKRQNVITTWHDRRITAGSDLNHAISRELEEAQIILLLISAHFLASDYCYDKEMTRALEKHHEGSAIVIPVILHPCDWMSSPFKNLRATPTDAKPVSMYTNQHEAFAIVAQDVRQAAEQLHVVGPVAKSVTNGLDRPVSNLAENSLRSSNLRVKRKFVDHERDEFLEKSYDYIARYFEGSLQELAKRNPQIQARYKRLDATSFSASIYENGKRVAECSVWYGGTFGSAGISYSHSSDVARNSYNENLRVEDDGYTLQLKALGMHQSFHGKTEDAMSQQGGAEFFWSMLVQRLQD
jgi:hypothetical protein